MMISTNPSDHLHNKHLDRPATRHFHGHKQRGSVLGADCAVWHPSSNPINSYQSTVTAVAVRSALAAHADLALLIDGFNLTTVPHVAEVPLLAAVGKKRRLEYGDTFASS